MDISLISRLTSYPTKPTILYTAPIIPYNGDFSSLLYKKKKNKNKNWYFHCDFGGFHGDFIYHTQPHPTRFFLTLTCLYWGLTTRQPLWVILCRLPEKGRKETEEIAEEMKERDREERGTGMKVKKQKK